MHNSDNEGAMQATLRFLLASDMPAEHKRLLIELVTDALRRRDAKEAHEHALQRDMKPWDEDEVAQIAAYLDGKTARSWQHADEMVVALASLLHRDARDVREKAADIGFHAAVAFTRPPPNKNQ
jgi:hypothetical protein